MNSRGRTCTAFIGRRYCTAATLAFPSLSRTAPAGMSMVSHPVNPESGCTCAVHSRPPGLLIRGRAGAACSSSLPPPTTSASRRSSGTSRSNVMVMRKVAACSAVESPMMTGRNAAFGVAVASVDAGPAPAAFSARTRNV